MFRARALFPSGSGTFRALCVLAALAALPSHAAKAASGAGADEETPTARDYFLKARESEMQGRDSAALDSYRLAFSRDSRSRDLCFLLLDHLKDAGRIDSAAALGKRCVVLDGAPTVSEYKSLGEVQLRAGDSRAALASYRAAYALDDDDGDVLYVLGGLYEANEDWAGYAEIVRKLLPRLEYPASLMDKLLEAYRRLGDARAADDAGAALAEAWKGTGKIAYGQALALYYDSRGLDRSLLDVARTLEASSDAPEFEWLLARALIACNRPDSALTSYKRLRAKLPDNDEVAFAYAALLFNQGRYDEAYALSRKLVEQHPEVSAHRFLLGSAATELRLPKVALPALEKASAEVPLSLDYRVRLAYARLAFSDGARAAEALVFPADSLKPAPRLFLQGLATEQLARNLEPRGPRERRSVFQDTAAARRYRLQAAELFRAALRLDSASSAAAFELATDEDRLGDRAEATRLLRALVARDSLNGTALNYLGYLLIEKEGASAEDRAFSGRLLAKAVSLEPENGAYLDSKGWWHYRAGELDSARLYIAKAADCMPDDPDITGHWAAVLEKSGDAEGARAAWEALLRLDPANAEARAKVGSAAGAKKKKSSAAKGAP